MLLGVATSLLLVGLLAAVALGLLLWLFLRGLTAQRLLAWEVDRLRREQEQSGRALAAGLREVMGRGEALEAQLPRLGALEPKLGQVAADARALLGRLSEFEGALARHEGRLSAQEGDASRGTEERLALLGQVGSLEQRLSALSDALSGLEGGLAERVRALAQRVEDLSRRPGGAPPPGAPAVSTGPSAPTGARSPVADRAPTPHFVLPPVALVSARPAVGAQAPEPGRGAPGRPGVPWPLRLALAGILGVLALATVGAVAWFAT